MSNALSIKGAPGIKMLMFRILIVTASAVCFYGAYTATTRRVTRAQSMVTPYFLEMEATSFKVTEDNVMRTTEARRSDGAVMVQSPTLGRLGLRAGETTREITFVDGTVVMIADSIAAKATFPAKNSNDRLPTSMLNPPANCVSQSAEKFVGNDNVMGQETAIVTRSLANEDFTFWRAPALGCLVLRYRVEIPQPNGSRKLQLEAKPLNLTLGEPDPRLFDLGESYAELKPSEIIRRQAQRVGLSWNEEIDRESQRSDQKYFKANGRN